MSNCVLSKSDADSFSSSSDMEKLENGIISYFQTVSKQSDPGYADIHLIDVSIWSKNRKNPLQIKLFERWKGTVTASGLEADIRNLVASAKPGRGTGFKKKNKGGPFRKESNMSLHLPNSMYLIFRVDEDAGLRFTADHNGFSFDAKLPDDTFMFSRRLDDAGNMVPDEPNGAGNWDSDKRMFLVAVDYDKLHKKSDGAGVEHKVARFNLHLDVLDNPNNPATSAYIPIVVDPDVRFPGGNGDP